MCAEAVLAAARRIEAVVASGKQFMNVARLAPKPVSFARGAARASARAQPGIAGIGVENDPAAIRERDVPRQDVSVATFDHVSGPYREIVGEPMRLAHGALALETPSETRLENA